MAHKVTCDACKNTLDIPNDVVDPWLTCPRCLARVVNPMALVRRDVPAPTPGPASEAAARTCPACGQPVEAAWRFCPFCDTALRRRRTVRLVPVADRQVRWDTGWAGGGLVVLGLVLTVGVLLALVAGWKQDNPNILVPIGMALLVLVLVGIGLGLASRRPAASGGTGILGGITIMLILLGMPLAVCLGFFNTCLRGCPPAASSRPPSPAGARP